MESTGDGGGTTRRRLLFVTPFAPDLEGTHGGARATGAIIAMLARHHDVRVVHPVPAGSAAPRRPPAGCRSIRPVPVPSVSRPKERLWFRLLRTARLLLGADPAWAVEARTAEMAEAVSEEALRAQPEIVHFEFHIMAQYIQAVRKAAPRAACIVTEHEPGVAAEDLADGRMPLARRLGRHARRRSWKRFEARVLAQADAIVAFTQSDCSHVRQLLGSDRPPAACIPFRLPLPPSASSGGAGAVASDVLFIGNFNHPPNADAALRLVRGIMPKVWQVLPEAKLCMVGADPPPWLLAARDARTCVTGLVESTAGYLSGAAVAVAPLWQGGGMRVKVIEACLHGMALVATPCAVRGLSLQDQSDFLLANDDEHFAAAIIALLRDPRRRAELGMAARAWAERTQSHDAWLAEYEFLHRTLCTSGSSGTR